MAVRFIKDRIEKEYLNVSSKGYPQIEQEYINQFQTVVAHPAAELRVFRIIKATILQQLKLNFDEP